MTPEQIAGRLTEAQRAFLLHGEPILTDQPATPEEWDGVLACELFVEADDGDDIWPPTRHWFAGASAHYRGDGKPWNLSYRYNDLGLQVRAHLTKDQPND